MLAGPSFRLAGQGRERAQIDGPHVWLAMDVTHAIAVTLHERATNASKYGLAAGHLCIKWSRGRAAHALDRERRPSDEEA